MLRTIAGIILAAVLLVIAYPQIEWWPLAWVALVPLLLIIDGKSYQSAFGGAYLCGFLFFSGTLGWFIYVTTPGAVLLIAYLSFYFALFGVAFKWTRSLSLLSRIFIVPSIWVVLEFLRAHLFTGFGWVLLGHSQYKNFVLIQIADISGVYGVSFLVMLVNVLIFESIKLHKNLSFQNAPRLIHSGTSLIGNPGMRQKAGPPIATNGSPRYEGEIFGGDNIGINSRQLRRAQFLVGIILCSVLGYGVWRIITFPAGTTVGVGVVQPNIPQVLKWDERLQPWVVQKTLTLSEEFKDVKPDLIVWPETSLPGVTSEVPELTGAIKAAAGHMHTPILMGAITDEQGKYYNSAYLISADGKLTGRHDKIHLVPFGEYIPLRPVLGWINRYVPLEDFTPGNKYTIFSLPQTPPSPLFILKRGRDAFLKKGRVPTYNASPLFFSKRGLGGVPFGVLICFEDTLGYLWRNFVNAGAGFLVNMTNDAWFLDTKAPFIHMQAAVFGCVENKRALVRAANTGFSGFIDPFGRMIAAVEDRRHKKTFISGVAYARVPVVQEKTVYTKYGDIFTMLCLFGILSTFIRRKVNEHRGIKKI